MSSLIYPASLPGLTYNSVRTPTFKNGAQEAMSGKESRIAYMQYPRMKWTLTYELLRDYVTPSDLKAYFGLFMAMGGGFDTFLYNDPQFNGVTAQQFAVGDGTVGPFQVTATYQNSSGPGAPELIQNFNGSPLIYANGVLQTLTTNYTLSGTGGVTFTSGHVPSIGAPLTWTGNFYYRARFLKDELDFNQFLANFWELQTVELKQVKL
jgi:uncharacterized protein (TIGR02217 family)